MTAPILLQRSVASDDERDVISGLLDQLSRVSVANREAREYYDGSRVTADFGISIPPSMRSLHTVAGWAGTVVDVLEERLDWLGWSADEDLFGLDEVFAANSLDSESGMTHLDALIFGLSFVAVGSGRAGEPSPLVTPMSPEVTTGDWDARRRRLSAALTVNRSESFDVTEVTLYMPTSTATFRRRTGGLWSVVDRDDHKLGRVPVVLIPNRARGSRSVGRSEITRAVRYYTDAAARTLKGLEVNREFYNSPQRVALGVDESAFQDANGDPVSAWSAIQGRLWVAPPNDDGMPAPDIKQFAPSSPAPYLDQVRGYAQLLAAEAGIPGGYLGFQSDNPASADAIRAGEARLVKRAERRQTIFGRAWTEVARLALMVRDAGVVPDGFDMSISTRWRDAATPTRAAAADEAVKLISAGVLPPDSQITYDRIGLTPPEQRQVEADKRRDSGRRALELIADARSRGDAATEV